MIKCTKCNKEITTTKNIKSIQRTENSIIKCICKQCSNKISGNTMIYRKFKPCKRCGKTAVEALPFVTYEEDEMCEWCRLALKADIDDLKLFDEDKKQKNTYNDELETLFWIEDMEDWGAFTDEGIMPGCHSDYTVTQFEIEEMEKLDKRSKEIGLLIKATREKMELSIAELAKAVDITEDIEQDIENGKTYFLHKYIKAIGYIAGIGRAIPTSSNIQLNENHCVEEKKWWESCEEYEILEEVWKYLYVNCALLNVTRKNFRYTNSEFSEYIKIKLTKDDHRYEFDELKAGDIFAIHDEKSNAIDIYIVQIDQNGHMHGISLENGDAVFFKGNSEVTKYIKEMSLVEHEIPEELPFYTMT